MGKKGPFYTFVFASRDMFSNIDVLRSRNGVDNLVRGVVGTPTENVDDNFSAEVK